SRRPDQWQPAHACQTIRVNARGALDRPSPQKRLGKPPVHGNQMARGTASARTCEKENRLCAVGWIDGLVGERTFGIEGGQQAAEFFITQGFVEGDAVFGE